MTSTRKAGPKAAADASPLHTIYRRKRSKSFDDFCRAYVPIRSANGPKPLKPRPWQLDLVGSVFDPKEQPRLAGWMRPRGQGKSSLCAAVALWQAFCGQYAGEVVILAVDERQAQRLLDICVWMVDNSPELSKRAVVFRDRIEVPGNSATIRTLPAEEKRIQGIDPTFAVLDEAGFSDTRVFESLIDAQGKREQSTVLLIGTPGYPDSPLERVREAVRSGDASIAWREFSADEFTTHPIDCRHCWALSMPALGDFYFEDAVRQSLPPKTTESRFRLVRLCQFVEDSADAYMDPGEWEACSDPNRLILPGADVVIGLDGSLVSDCTALVMVSVEARPIVQILGLWEPELAEAGYVVPILDVEERVRQAAATYKVLEVAADPYLYTRSLAVLRDDGLPVVDFPNSIPRMAGPVAAFREAVRNGELTHPNDPKLTRHVLNAVVREHERGLTVSKVSKKSSRKIDCLIAGLMAHSRARWHYSNKPAKKGLYVF